jgi:hypothetical protein
MNIIKKMLAFLLLLSVLSACKKEKEAAPAKPSLTDLEIGLNNNQIGVTGRDFHFNANVLAASKIDTIRIDIRQKAGETYARAWKHEVIWTEYRDAKNATVHKHFDIPSDAVEGKYDFQITVTEVNGSKLELKTNLTIYHPQNLPVDPKLSIFNLFVNDEIFYRNGRFNNPGSALKKGDVLHAQAAILNVKGDGKLYLLLIKKTLNHRPESIAAIDFSKAIVYDYFEHRSLVNTQSFSNLVFNEATYTITRNWPDLVIGGLSDNGTPQALITGNKSWSSGTYYFGLIYQNTTYNSTVFNYLELNLDFK